MQAAKAKRARGEMHFFVPSCLFVNAFVVKFLCLVSLWVSVSLC